MIRWLVPVLAVLWAAGASAAEPVLRYEAGDGAYLAVAPSGWDGKSRLGVLMFLHGYRGSASGVMADDAVAPVADAAGMMLVAPEGLDGTWSHRGSPSHRRDDVAFLRAVAADVRRRFPVDDGSFVVAGFSQGGSMAWDLACYGAAGFTSFLSFAGGFWEPMPRTCPSGPVVLRHVHGRADAVVPMAGRVIQEQFRQADITEGMAFWRRADECPDQPNRMVTAGALQCSVWSSCRKGAVALCLHRGGHEMEAGWLADGLDWVRGR